MGGGSTELDEARRHNARMAGLIARVVGNLRLRYDHPSEREAALSRWCDEHEAKERAKRKKKGPEDEHEGVQPVVSEVES